ncbi:trehalose-phosphatase [Amycolatopsis marina]|uniref:Trehalose-phosphatase n=1 Tax=Amycolatopsis marina TaxID=490629 RepID=A0A1I1AQW8_9PSEU|nr:trehalose-phosphatase [Amycolatopsis marina]SFB40431.1 trehalose-phosphatase [Amycolatopsis marina]
MLTTGLGLDEVATLPAGLREEIGRIARTPRLLVGCDYDGTLAPFVSDPDAAKPLAESVAALRGLAALHETSAVVISGRALRDLATLSRLPAEVQLVGSHGSEFDAGFVRQLDRGALSHKQELHERLKQLIQDRTGVTLEVKPAGFAVHVRNADRHTAQRTLDEVRGAEFAGVQVVEGNEVVELTVVPTDKGRALDSVRRDSAATATVFIGDGPSDENAFGRLASGDLSVKVGPGDTIADYRLRDPKDVALALALLKEQRHAWLHGEQATPIERHSMLANERSIALVTPDGAVSWMCYPEPDSSALFAQLLGGTTAGHFTVSPARTGLPLGQRYLPGTMTVETRWSGLRVTDYLDHAGSDFRTDLIRVITGDVPAVVQFAPRPEFGQIPVKLVPDGDCLRVVGTSDPITLYAPGVRWSIDQDGPHETARAVVNPAGKASVVLELRCGSTSARPHYLPEPTRRALAGAYWVSWLNDRRLPQVERSLVARSALTLRGLCHDTTGAILAAATTSLPEEIGGIRNWDYRYCWIRDAAITARCMVSLGSVKPAERFLGWLGRILAELPGPERLHPLYTLGGATLGPEAVIETLPGYAGSRPVRVGNLAGQQVQLDVFGPVVELITDLGAERGWLSEEEWALVTQMVEAVDRRWQEPDHGIWEERIRPRHHVYTKVMCWVAVDRALRLAETLGKPHRERWAELRAAIATDVLEHGWNAEVGSFTTAYDGDDLDAATLHIGLSGLLDPEDPRFHATVLATEAQLRYGSTVYRYRRDDGLPGKEGGFHFCTAWLVEAYLLTGRRLEAEELFKHLVDSAGPTGLLPEEYDPVAERSLGNHPQAYSHVGLIRCAQLLSG